VSREYAPNVVCRLYDGHSGVTESLWVVSDAPVGDARADASLLAAAPKLRDALAALLGKHEQIQHDPQYLAIWALAALHGQKYEGPSYIEEVHAARAALAACEEVRRV
jgi:hypothetical protein